MKRMALAVVATVVSLGLIFSPVSAKTYKDLKAEQAQESQPTKKAEKAQKKASDRAWLGVYMQTLDEDMADAFDLPDAYGVVISEVVDDSPAEEAGLEEDDVIIRIDGNKVYDTDDLIDEIGDRRPGDRVEITVIRDEKEEGLTVTLGEHPDDKWIISRSDDDIGLLKWRSARDGALLGVSLMDLNKQLGDYFGVTRGRGALVTEVYEGTPAEASGLKAGDVIISIDDEQVDDADDVREEVADRDPGDEVRVTVLRDKREQTFAVELAERDDDWDEYSFQFEVPDVTPLVPKLRKLPKVPDAPGAYYFDRDRDEYRKEMQQFKEEMEKFKAEMKAFQKEMQELKEKLE